MGLNGFSARRFLPFILSLSLPLLMQAQPNNSATISVSVNGSNCDVSLYLQRNSGASWKLGLASFVFNFNSSAMTWNSELTEGIWDNNTSSAYGDQYSSSYYGGTARSIEIDFIGSAGEGTDVPTSATLVGTLRFTITNSSANHNISWYTGATVVYDDAGNDKTLDINFQDPSNGPLPIQLASFAATVVRGNDVEVAWKTVSETNNYGFEVYRKRGQTAEWTKVGFVEGHGTTLAPQSYSYIDRSVSFGKYFYRIKQIDLDGKSETFPDMAVTVGVGPGKFVLAQNYPNPFNPSTVIEFVVPVSGHTTMKVYNVLGQEVATLFEGNAEAGKINVARFDASNLPSGLYFYTLRSAGKLETKRMLLMK